MNVLQLIQVVVLGFAAVLFVIAGMYLVRAGRYNQSTAAFWRARERYSSHDTAGGDQEYAEGKRLQSRAEHTFRWLP